MTTPTPVRRILMCVSGMTPAIVTETLFALVTQASPFIPHEIHVVTTAQGKVEILKSLLSTPNGYFHRFKQEYLLGHCVRFDADTVHVITQSNPGKPNPFAQLVSGAKLDPIELDDITTAEDNRAAADTIYRVMRELKAVPHTELHASVAGGRKSMSFYMGHAFSLLATAQDKLSHVLVNAPFEHPKLGFFYPPRSPITLQWQDGQSGLTQSISTDQAEVTLAELSVLRLGALMGGVLPLKAQNSFDFAVKLAQAMVEPPVLSLALDADNKGVIRVLGETVYLTPQQFAVFALYALARVHEDDLADGAHFSLDMLPSSLWDAMAITLGSSSFSEAAKLPAVRSKIQSTLRDILGPVASYFAIEPTGVRKTIGNYRAYALKASAVHLKIIGLDSWWILLKEELVASRP